MDPSYIQLYRRNETLFYFRVKGNTITLCSLKFKYKNTEKCPVKEHYQLQLNFSCKDNDETQIIEDNETMTPISVAICR